MSNNETTKVKYEKVLLGLPRPIWTPVACHWQITGDLNRKGFTAIEIAFFHTLLPELLTPQLYIAVIHSQLLDLEDSANCDRATLIKLSLLLPKSIFIIWDKNDSWEACETLPKNLLVWSHTETNDITQNILKLLERG